MFFFGAHLPNLHNSCPAARYIFLDFLKKKIQKGYRYIGANLDFQNFQNSKKTEILILGFDFKNQNISNFYIQDCYKYITITWL